MDGWMDNDAGHWMKINGSNLQSKYDMNVYPSFHNNPSNTCHQGENDGITKVHDSLYEIMLAAF